MFSVSWEKRNVDKAGHGSDLSKWRHPAVDMVDGVRLLTENEHNIQYVSSDAIVS